jgi:hypothetical protein
MLQSELRCQMRSSSEHAHPPGTKPKHDDGRGNHPLMKSHSLIHSRCYPSVYRVGGHLDSVFESQIPGRRIRRHPCSL